MSHVVDRVGRRYGLLTVESRAENNTRGRTQWLCRCDCGGEAVVWGSNLQTGVTRSCGCRRQERHGLHGTPEYWAVVMARQRCENTNCRTYGLYGGRGIEYRLPANPGAAAQLLIDAIGRRPDGTSLDRIDNDGHYEIGNLRWATRREQMLNTRRAKANRHA